MNDRLTVLKGLHEAECLLEDRVPARFRGKALQAVRDAMVMIDARVLSPVELMGLPAGSVVWEEYRMGNTPERKISPMIVSREHTLIDEDGEIEINGRIYEPVRMFMDEPKQRRFWTNKPTKEQRQAAAWYEKEEQP